MIKKINLDDESIVKVILELQILSYTEEAKLINFENLPPLLDSINLIKNSSETFYGYFIDNLLVGIISYKIQDNLLDIHRLAVHPMYFKQGIASKLLNYIENQSEVNKFIVSTGKDNIPAINFYKKKGFIKITDEQLPEGIVISSFEKINN